MSLKSYLFTIDSSGFYERNKHLKILKDATLYFTQIRRVLSKMDGVLDLSVKTASH